MSSSSSSSSLYSSIFKNATGVIQYYTVSHPTISNFTWSPTHTPLSSLPFLITTIITYLSLALFFPFPPLPPRPFHILSSLHNSLLLLLSSAMALAISLASLRSFPSPSYLFCFPLTSRNYSTPSGPVFFWAYVFYLSKLYELLDTLLILLNPKRRSNPTFLHLYHHSLVLLMCYLWLATKQSMFPLALLTNASVHVLMYSYYLSASLGWRWPSRWKKMVTRVQIWQFVVSFCLSLVFLWMHFFRGGCRGMKGWLFNATFNASLLLLFLNFHARAYGDKLRGDNPDNKKDDE